MTKISFNANSTGTGSFLIESPNSNTNRTLTLPDSSGTFNISGLQNQVPPGTVTAPSIYPTGDTNTGLYFPSTDNLALVTGGAEAIRVNSAGNITTPLQPAIFLDGNNPAQINFTAGQQLLTSTYYTSKFSRGGMSWNSTNGRVTVPIAGVYAIAWNGYENVSTGRIVIQQSGTFIHVIHFGGTGVRGVTILSSIPAGGYIEVAADGLDLPQLFMGSGHTSFSMYLVG